MIDDRSDLATSPARALALECVEVGIAAGDPERLIAEQVELSGSLLRVMDEQYDLASVEELIVLGGGKAAARQAAALESVLGDRITDGVVVTAAPDRRCQRIEVLAGDHPVPSDHGLQHTARLLDLASAADSETLVLVLLSGGGSALLTAPAEGISLADLQDVTQSLLDSGATIAEMNAVRKHLSAIKGGGLARLAAPARVVSLLMSDVVGDDHSVIASGPTVPDPTTFEDAWDVVDRYELTVPDSVERRLRAGCRGEIPETPKPGDCVFDRVDTVLLADSGTPMRAVAAHLDDREPAVVQLSARIRGEAREAAKTHVAIAEEIQASGHPVSPPAVLLSGGETTVTVRGKGVGGPNLEFALSSALELDEGITIAAVDTDGIDGAAPAAGAIVDATTLDDRRRATAALDANDAYPALRDRDDVIVTGPTGTNLNDLRVVIVEPLE